MLHFFKSSRKLIHFYFLALCLCATHELVFINLKLGKVLTDFWVGNLTGIAQNLLHYNDTRTHHYSCITSQYHYQKQPSLDALRTRKTKCTELNANPGSLQIRFPSSRRYRQAAVIRDRLIKMKRMRLLRIKNKSHKKTIKSSCACLENINNNTYIFSIK